MGFHRAAFLAAILYVGLAVAGSSVRGGVDPSGARSATPPREGSGKRSVTFRGEIVDYYCYIEKGLTGPAHRECGLKCVAGDVCMGLLTEDDELYMLSVNHLRAMTPTAFEGIPDAFTQCRSMISMKVELHGKAMQRKGQKIVEVESVKKI
jgi:hypothetical protein